MSSSEIPQSSLAAAQDPETLAISLTSRPTPSPGPGQALVRITHTGLCAADLHLARRNLPYLLPQHGITVFGHEGAGVVAALGPGPPDPPDRRRAAALVRVGDRVGVRFLHRVCGACELCLAGSENLCAARRVTGRDLDGALAQFALADAAYLVPLPAAVPDRLAAPVLCAGVTVYKALRLLALPGLAVPRGGWVAVAGAGGGLGHLGAQYARALGWRVVGVDVGRKEACARLVDEYVDAARGDVVERVVRLTGGGAHAALVTAGSGRAYADAVGYLRRAGVLMCVGAPAERRELPLAPEDFISKGIKVLGSSTGTIQDTVEALEFVARGEVMPIVQVRDLKDVDKALQDLEDGQVEGRLVIKIP
jgi:alcohol dehydrogenase, propanol-preferring